MMGYLIEKRPSIFIFFLHNFSYPLLQSQRMISFIDVLLIGFINFETVQVFIFRYSSDSRSKLRISFLIGNNINSVFFENCIVIDIFIVLIDPGLLIDIFDLQGSEDDILVFDDFPCDPRIGVIEFEHVETLLHGIDTGFQPT